MNDEPMTKKESDLNKLEANAKIGLGKAETINDRTRSICLNLSNNSEAKTEGKPEEERKSNGRIDDISNILADTRELNISTLEWLEKIQDMVE